MLLPLHFQDQLRSTVDNTVLDGYFQGTVSSVPTDPHYIHRTIH